MPSEKTVVVEHLFFSNWDPATRSLRQALINQDEVVRAIQHCNRADGLRRSTNNPANFMKDIVRKATASNNWPARVTALRYTAVQRTGNRNVFEFIPFEPGQTEPFPDKYKFTQGVSVFAVQSLSMLAESKMLGRRDEAWLTQTAVKLAVAESHFAFASPLRAEVLDIIHLQMGMKLRDTEMDAAYMIRRRGADDEPITGAVTVEAKQEDERVLENQLVAQAKAIFAQGRFKFAIPMAMRAVANRGIYVAEFEPVLAQHANAYASPVLVAEALYELSPPVPGI